MIGAAFAFLRKWRGAPPKSAAETTAKLTQQHPKMWVPPKPKGGPSEATEGMLVRRDGERIGFRKPFAD
jgi:hypothetical protein